jgi:predicted PurR-regulated permease PerM
MTNENLQINIGANTQDLQAGLNQASQSVNNFSNQLSKAAKPTADATRSLVDLSRIAQDAPYGFMGIANNLNPMLESFQRLQKESGSTGNALKSMVAGLAGPAGLGVALGVVSSLIVAFGDDFADFFSKLTSGSSTLQETNKAFHEAKDAFSKAYIEMQNLGNSFEAFHNGTKSKKSVLDEYNQTLGKVYGSTKDINEAERLYTANSESYVKAALYRAASQIALKKAAEEAFKQQELAANPKAAGMGGDLFGSLAAGALSKFTGAPVLSMAEVGAFQSATEKSKGLEKTFLDISKSFNTMVESTNASAEKSVLFGQEATTKQNSGWSDSMKAAIKEAEDLIKEYNSLTRPSRAERRRATPIENELPEQEDLTKKKLSSELPMWAKTANAETAKLDKQLQQAQKNAESFAQSIAGSLTNGIMGMWDAIERGDNVLDAFSNFLKDMVKQLAAAVIQAILFQTIMSALGFGGAGAGGGGAAGGIIGGLGSILGFAEGGIVSQPTIAMVGEGGQSEAIMPLNKLGNMMNSTFNAGAMSGQGGGGNGQFVLKGNDLVLALSRSNYSLNLRRGA